MKIVPFALVLFALGCIVEHVAGCSPTAQQALAANVENAAAVAQYEALLDDCRKQGRASASYAVYSTCADAVDAHLCAQHRLRCKEDR